MKNINSENDAFYCFYCRDAVEIDKIEALMAEIDDNFDSEEVELIMDFLVESETKKENRNETKKENEYESKNESKNDNDILGDLNSYYHFSPQKNANVINFCIKCFYSALKSYYIDVDDLMKEKRINEEEYNQLNIVANFETIGDASGNFLKDARVLSINELKRLIFH